MPDTFNWYEDTEKVIKEIWEVADEYIKEECDKIADVGNPEDLLKKPYAQWTPQDKQRLSEVYVYDKKPLNDFIAKKEIDKLFESIKFTESLEV